MEYTALWGPKGFIVSPEKIVPLNDLVTSIALKQDNGTDTSGTSPTNTKGKEPQTISLSTTYVKSAGVDPRSQIDEWTAEVGNAYTLYIGGVQFGPSKLKLTKVDVTNILLSPKGTFLSVKVAVTLEEYVEQVSTTPTTTLTTAEKKAANMKKAAEHKFATLIAPTLEDKATKANSTVGVGSDSASTRVGTNSGSSASGGFSIGVAASLGGGGGGGAKYKSDILPY